MKKITVKRVRSLVEKYWKRLSINNKELKDKRCPSVVIKNINRRTDGIANIKSNTIILFFHRHPVSKSWTRNYTRTYSWNGKQMSVFLSQVYSRTMPWGWSVSLSWSQENF